MAIDRRGFIGWAAAALPAAALGGCADSDPPAAASAAATGAEDSTLEALAEAVLPSELGEAGRVRTVGEFREWLAGFQPVAELNHGYGTGDIDYTPADPAPGWMAQLRALDLEARQRSGDSFAALDSDARRAMVRGQIGRGSDSGFPAIAGARHVAIGLLAFFYDSPAATDLCYRAQIGKQTCRPLATSPEKPAPLGAT